MVLTYRNKFNRKFGFDLNASHSLKEISKLTKYNLDGLTTIFKKGQGAYFSAPHSVRPHIKSASEWGMARVYASIDPTSLSSIVDRKHLF
jgi:hypothetical protein